VEFLKTPWGFVSSFSTSRVDLKEIRAVKVKID